MPPGRTRAINRGRGRGRRDSALTQSAYSRSVLYESVRVRRSQLEPVTVRQPTHPSPTTPRNAYSTSHTALYSHRRTIPCFQRPTLTHATSPTLPSSRSRRCKTRSSSSGCGNGTCRASTMPTHTRGGRSEWPCLRHGGRSSRTERWRAVSSFPHGPARRGASLGRNQVGRQWAQRSCSTCSHAA